LGLRDFLHNKGFILEKRIFKLFVFSRLMGKVFIDEEKNNFMFYPPFQLVIGSPVERIIYELAAGLMKRPVVYIHGQGIEVESVEVIPTVVSESSIIIRAISPITVYSSVENSSRHYTYYYSPFEFRFEETIRQNLIKKHIIVFAKHPEEDNFKIEPIYVNSQDQKIVKFKGTIIKGWMGTYRLTADPRLIELALSAGLGSKNSQGFGCVVPAKVLDKKQSKSKKMER